MSRHRAVRQYDYNDYSDDDDDYDGGFSGSPSSASPSTAMYMMNRNKPATKSTLGNFLEKKQEGGERALIERYLPQVLEVVPLVSEDKAVEALRKHKFAVEKAIDSLLQEFKKEEHKKQEKDAEVFKMDIEEDDVVLNARKQAIKQKKGDAKKDAKPAEAVKPGELETKLEAMVIEEDKFTPIKAKRPAYMKEEDRSELTRSSEKPKQQAKQMPASRRTEIEKAMKAKVKDKEHINLVVIGHVDAGKSTLMGHLLYILGIVNQKTMHKYEKDSKIIGKGSFSYAWVLDEHEEERARGITMDVGVTAFETPHRRVTLLDAPGHRDFVPNMISGAAQADVAILVIDSGLDQFEKGFESDGQTKEHALLARSLGVVQLGVVINKLDSVGWSQERYDKVVAKLTQFLKQSGFREKNMWFLPASGLSGENLVERKEKGLEWYKGPTLVERIDAFEPAERETAKPFRFCVSDVYKGQGGTAVGGKVETGIVTVGDKLLLLPLNEVCTVKGVRLHNNSLDYAIAGDNVDLSLVGVEMQNIGIGNILCDPEFPVQMTNKFVAQIITFTLQRPIITGHTAELHYQSLNEVANVTQLISILDKSTGEVKKKKPRALGDSITAVVQITTQHPLCLELYSNCKPLGRFTLRESGKTIAAGIITELK